MVSVNGVLEREVVENLQEIHLKIVLTRIVISHTDTNDIKFVAKILAGSSVTVK
jgi:hypothetical protein